jgi:GTP-binding protein Era
VNDPRAATEGQRSGFVALIGWTNVGKSTLLNRLVGTELAAVAGVAQTTRRRIQGARTLPGRGQIVFVDTPGLHEPRHGMNRAMVEAVRRALSEVDATALVIDATRPFGAGDRRAAELVCARSAPRLAVLNKIDRLPDKPRLLPLIDRLSREWGFREVVPVSALHGDGCDRLTEAILGLLPHGPPLFDEDYLTDQPQRVLAAEWIREKLLHATRQELPHATAVLVERWSERADGLLSIEATILVERESQKGIVIGREGRLLKQVGSAARVELERRLGTRVFLELWVRVRERWRDDERMLRRLGLTD